MNATMAAAAMVQKAEATRKNIAFEEMIGGSFFVKRAPMIAPQKDGNLALVRVVRGSDENVADLDSAAATALLATWLEEVVIDLPNERVRARFDAKLDELGWR